MSCNIKLLLSIIKLYRVYRMCAFGAFRYELKTRLYGNLRVYRTKMQEAPLTLTVKLNSLFMQLCSFNFQPTKYNI